MLFVATCIDKPESAAARQENRPAHLAYLASLGAKVRAAGALLADDHRSAVGSMLIFEAADEAEVAILLAGDPYAKAGLFSTVGVKPWRQAVGVPLAG
jgi:hypothetical protein